MDRNNTVDIAIDVGSAGEFAGDLVATNDAKIVVVVLRLYGELASLASDDFAQTIAFGHAVASDRCDW